MLTDGSRGDASLRRRLPVRQGCSRWVKGKGDRCRGGRRVSGACLLHESAKETRVAATWLTRMRVEVESAHDAAVFSRERADRRLVDLKIRWAEEDFRGGRGTLPELCTPSTFQHASQRRFERLCQLDCPTPATPADAATARSKAWVEEVVARRQQK